MKWQYLLIPVGFGLLLVGLYIINYSFAKVASEHPSAIELQNRIMSTDYPIGSGLFSLGIACIIIIIIWKYKSSKKKP